MKLIALHGKDGIRGFAAVDDEDFDRINQHRWFRDKAGYARRSTHPGSGSEYMHRVVLPNVEFVDHINGDKIDNRRQNLRSCTRAQNQMNQRPKGGLRKNKLGLKGVCRNHGRYMANITANKVQHYLGTFDTPEEAHAAYCEAAKRLHGEFARTA